MRGSTCFIIVVATVFAAPVGGQEKIAIVSDDGNVVTVAKVPNALALANFSNHLGLVAAGTKVRLLGVEKRDPDIPATWTKVQLLEGKYKDKIGWVMTQVVKPVPPQRKTPMGLQPSHDGAPANALHVVVDATAIFSAPSILSPGRKRVSSGDWIQQIAEKRDASTSFYWLEVKILSGDSGADKGWLPSHRLKPIKGRQSQIKHADDGRGESDQPSNLGASPESGEGQRPPLVQDDFFTAIDNVRDGISNVLSDLDDLREDIAKILGNPDETIPMDTPGVLSHPPDDDQPAFSPSNWLATVDKAEFWEGNGQTHFKFHNTADNETKTLIYYEDTGKYVLEQTNVHFQSDPDDDFFVADYSVTTTTQEIYDGKGSQDYSWINGGQEIQGDLGFQVAGNKFTLGLNASTSVDVAPVDANPGTVGFVVGSGMSLSETSRHRMPTAFPRSLMSV
jgi:hypothetical protein